jgi:galactose mutarotase-like enzyme
LADTSSQSSLVLAPSRGGLATRWTIGERDVFYLDEGTLRDPSKNVRGGNPVLFPSPGKLVDGRYERGGKRGTLNQHGFARTLPWTVAERSTVDAATVLLRLVSNDQTRAVFDWDFSLEYRYILRGTTLRINQSITNSGTEPMPFGAGFHPYFYVKQGDKASTRITTPATRAFDNIRQELGPLHIDLTAHELDLRLADHGDNPCRLETPSMKLSLSASPECSHWVLWTLSGQDFVCMEPWTCPANALNTGKQLLEVAPGATRSLWLELAVDA